MTFHRFPFPNQVKAWAKKTENLKDFRWSVKVNRLVTHVFKFSEKAFLKWKKFEKIFEPLRERIDFFLLQLPSILTPKSAERIEAFYKRTKLEEKLALEWRNLSWFEKTWVKWAENLGLTLVSIDAQDFEKFPREIYCTSRIAYLRMHGRTAWYSHYYTNKELEEIKGKILKTKAEKVYIYFNNDEMFDNAKRMFSLLKNEKVEENKIEKLKSKMISSLKRFVTSKI
jgi:uncharacterized protein YecE (DUF72 family)